MWQTPKTDWKWISEEEGDFFESGDYNRIKGNIEHLKSLALQAFLPFKFEAMGQDKIVKEYPYADEINLLADNLENIVAGTYPVNIGAKTIYVDNGIFIGYADLNRIETGCLTVYNRLTQIQAGKKRLSITLGRRAPF